MAKPLWPLGLVLSVLVTACGSSRPTDSPLPAEDAVIAYTALTHARNPQKNVAAIGIIDADGGNARRLTSPDTSAFLPSLSPDGTKIAYVTEAEGGQQAVIKVMDSSGSNVRQLTPPDISATFPTFSADGTKIAYTVTVNESMKAIHVANADGNNAHNVVEFIADDRVRPAFSPDGARIAFSQEIAGQYSNYVVNVDGTNLRPLGGESSRFAGQPSFSPDGNQIAYFAWSEAEGGAVYVMNSDGTNNRKVAETIDISCGFPAFSPSGKRIAFCDEIKVDGKPSHKILGPHYYAIFVMNADGTDVTQLTNVDINPQRPPKTLGAFDETDASVPTWGLQPHR